jgi:hypothetical protein
LLTGIHGRRCAATRGKNNTLKLFLPVFKLVARAWASFKDSVKTLAGKGFQRTPYQFSILKRLIFRFAGCNTPLYVCVRNENKHTSSGVANLKSRCPILPFVCRMFYTIISLLKKILAKS